MYFARFRMSITLKDDFWNGGETFVNKSHCIIVSVREWICQILYYFVGLRICVLTKTFHQGCPYFVIFKHGLSVVRFWHLGSFAAWVVRRHLSQQICFLTFREVTDATFFGFCREIILFFPLSWSRWGQSQAFNNMQNCQQSISLHCHLRHPEDFLRGMARGLRLNVDQFMSQPIR